MGHIGFPSPERKPKQVKPTLGHRCKEAFSHVVTITKTEFSPMFPIKVNPRMVLLGQPDVGAYTSPRVHDHGGGQKTTFRYLRYTVVKIDIFHGSIRKSLVKPG